MAVREVFYPQRVQSTTAGNPVDLDYDIVAAPTSFDVVLGVSNLGLPIPLIATAQVEGVDFPFLSRFNTAVAPLYVHWARAAADRWRQIDESTHWLGTPLPVMESPPDTTPLVVQRSLEYPAAAYAKRSQEAWRTAANSRADSPGSWIFLLPATEYTVPVCELLSEIQAHLLEDVNGGAFFSSGLWTVQEVLAYLNNRISRFLMETGVIQIRTTQAAPAADSFYNLPENLIDLRRVAWTAGSTTAVLPRSDAFEADMAYDSWDTVGGTPMVHMLVPEQSLEIRVAPKAAADGTLDLIYVADAPAVINDCSILPFPDEWAPYVKWGVISDMLSKEGEANDPIRARYAETRYNEGVALARLYMGTNQ